MSLSYANWYRFFQDQGSLVAGLFALAAGVMAYRAGQNQAAATKDAAERQLADARNRDRLQARSLAVGILPELLQLQVGHERASNIFIDLESIENNYTPVVSAMTQRAAHIIEAVRAASIEIPPVLRQNLDHLYILGEPAGPTTLQLCSVVFQYNHLIDALAARLSRDIGVFDPQSHRSALSGQLTAIAQLVADARAQIAPLHDEATGA